MLLTDSGVNLSIVVPLYNEEQNILPLFTRLETILNQLGLSYEIICVDDGSKDNTLSLLIEQHYINPAIKVVSFSRNFGKEAALTAGLDYSTGEAIIPIDADLQDPPELIVKLVEKWREGYEVVDAVRRTRHGESWLKKFTANAFYWVIDKVSEVPIPPATGDFRLLDRKVVDSLKQLPERTRFMKGLFAWVGFKQTAIFYDRLPRHQGNTKWNYWRLWNFAIQGIASFSTISLKVWSYLGLVLALVALLYATFLIIRTLVLGIDVPGYASLMVAILLLGGVQLITLGVIGEYLGRVYEEVKGRPIYLIRNSYGFDHDAIASMPFSMTKPKS
jgi:glycosyltransferase involved in cell wall biosynthesis